MPLSEFQIIEKYFTSGAKPGAVPVELGIGDDCALLDVPESMHLAVSTDTLLEEVHFLKNSDPFLLGHKALAVNLSDLAAMGAKPAWVTLTLTLPKVDEAWLKSFSEGFFQLAKQHQIQLIGGDTTRGNLSIGLTVMGLLPKGKGLRRSGANVGDGVYVTGSMGSAGVGLKRAKAKSIDTCDEDLMRYLKPQPCVKAGLNLLDIATACIDVSDGLSADLTHILTASGVGAILNHVNVPMSLGVQAYIKESGNWHFPYSSGDDYQLCFTMPENQEPCFDSSAWAGIGRPIKIGCIVAGSSLLIEHKGEQIVSSNRGYDHFR